MKILANKDIRNLFLAVSVIWAASLLLAQGFLWLRYQRLSLCLLFIFLLAAAAIWVVCCSYFKKQNKIMEQAVSQINVYLDGDSNARIECDSEGELYRLFHSVNSLAAVLNAHADNELREKEFLKNTISDISHQLKTPLAALNIYNGLLQEEDIEASSVKEFAGLSEQELDRIETLVQSLLKITKLDTGSVILEKATENVADMLRDVELHFAYRAKQEQKELILSGSEEVSLIGFGLCRDQLTLKSLYAIPFQNQRLSKLHNDRRFLLNAFQKGVCHVATGFADHGDDIMRDPAFEGFGFGLAAAQNKRVKSGFVHYRHVGIASLITLI